MGLSLVRCPELQEMEKQAELLHLHILIVLWFLFVDARKPAAARVYNLDSPARMLCVWNVKLGWIRSPLTYFCQFIFITGPGKNKDEAFKLVVSLSNEFDMDSRHGWETASHLLWKGWWSELSVQQNLSKDAWSHHVDSDVPTWPTSPPTR